MQLTFNFPDFSSLFSPSSIKCHHSLLQEIVLEKRLEKFLSVLATGKDFLKQELRNKGYKEELIDSLVLQSKHSSDLDNELDSLSADWSVSNYAAGKWRPEVMMM